MVPVVDPDPLAVSALPTPDSWEWFSETGEKRAPAWKNEATLRTVEMLMEYEPGVFVERISPTPLLMVVAAGDHLTPTDLALEAYQRAREPKRLVLLPGGHFEAYTGDFDIASGAARDWFLEHLGGPGRSPGQAPPSVVGPLVHRPLRPAGSCPSSACPPSLSDLGGPGPGRRLGRRRRTG